MTNPTHAPADMLDALLPCPFCGSDELSQGWSAPPHAAGVECHNCGASMVMVDEEGTRSTADLEAEAVTAWNRRASLPAGNEPVAVVPRDVLDAFVSGETSMLVYHPDYARFEANGDFAGAELVPLYASPLTPAEGETNGWNTDLTEVPRDRDFLIQFDHGEVTVGHYLDNSKTAWPWEGIRPVRSMRPNRVMEKIVAWREMLPPSRPAPSGEAKP